MASKGKRIDFIVSKYSNMLAVDFVKAVNNSYYFHSAEKYDVTHPDIYHDSAIAWKRIINVLKMRIKEIKKYKIVDVGSGSGFVGTRFLESGISFKCYIGLEPSDKMRGIAVDKVKSPRLSFLPFDISKNISDVLNKINGKKIITVNSVLHHIVWWEDFLTDIRNCLHTDDIFILCHEPNCRFWENSTLVNYFNKIIEEKMRSDRMAFDINPMNYLRKVLRILGLGGYSATSKYDIINKELRESSVIKKTLSPTLINAIIDYGVPLCWGEIHIDKDDDERFYSINYLVENFFKGMEILLASLNQHLALSPKVLSARWKQEEKRLEEKYPQDGAQFCLVIRKS